MDLTFIKKFTSDLVLTVDHESILIFLFYVSIVKVPDEMQKNYGRKERTKINFYN